MQTNFRNFYFKSGSPLPLPHIQKHTLIHHLFKKIVSISLSARSVIFFFSYASKSPNVDTDIIWAKGEKNFLFANTASFAQATNSRYILQVFFPSVSFCTLSDCTVSAAVHYVQKRSPEDLKLCWAKDRPSTVKSCQCLELIGIDAIKIQNSTELRAHHSQVPE